MVQTLIAMNQTVEAWTANATEEQKPQLIQFCEQFSKACEATKENMRQQVSILVGYDEPLPEDFAGDLEALVLMDLSYLP
jgi:hypothetical protein